MRRVSPYTSLFGPSAQLLRPRQAQSKLADFFIQFYLVGLLLFIFPYTRNLFIFLIPFSLLLVAGAVFLWYPKKIRGTCRPDAGTAFWFLIIYISSLSLEIAGVRTGEIFGSYSYGEGLGWKVCGTPLIIGLNWLMLIYAAYDIALRTIPRVIPRILFAALLMTLYDIVLEWAAPAMKMWTFHDGYPGWKNFAAWFIASALYAAGFWALRIRPYNPPARTLFLIQILFFILIGFYATLSGII